MDATPFASSLVFDVLFMTCSASPLEARHELNAWVRTYLEVLVLQMPQIAINASMKAHLSVEDAQVETDLSSFYILFLCHVDFA